MSAATATALLALETEAVDAHSSYVHLVPAGTFIGRDGRGPYSLVDPEAVIAASRQLAGEQQLVIDYNHSSDKAAQNGGPAPAAGWITAMQSRSDGIWGLVEWTARAAAHLAAREYRYLSPVIYHLPDGTITAVARASLTNTPNLNLKALASVEEKESDDTMNETELSELRQLLGLDAAAAGAAIVAKVRELTQTVATHASSEPDPTKWVKIGDFQRAVSEANKLRQGISLQAAQARVGEDIRVGKLLPWMNDWAVSLCQTSVTSYDDFMRGVGPGFSYLLKGAGAGASPPSLHAASRLSDDEKAACAAMGLTEVEYLKARGDHAI